MADHSTPPDLFDSHQEGSAYSSDDFEKLDAPMDTGFGFDREEVAAAGAYEPSQDAEISTTTDADISGEDDVEDQFNIGASEAEAYVPHSEPLISLGDEDNFPEDPVPVQPSAPVPENEPLLNFDNSTDDFVQSFKQPIISSSKEPDNFLSNNPLPPQPDAFNETEKIEPLEAESKQPSSDLSESAVDVTKGSWLKGVDPRVVDLIYWRDVKKTGIVFGAMMVILLSLAICSLVSVVAYLSLAALTVTFSFTIYKKVMGAVQKSNEGHPFKQLIEKDISLKEENLKCVIQSCLKHVNIAFSELRRLFLIEDMVDSIKFGLLLWVLTYIGAWFNGMTLIILDVILLFTLPKVYETYQTQIDSYIALAKTHVDNVLKIVQSKLPFLKKKDKTQ